MNAIPPAHAHLPDPASLQALLEDAAPEILAITSTPGAGIAVGYGDGRGLEIGHGMADLVTRAAFTARTPVPMASMSKLYTATAALQLAEQGRIELDAAAEDHLGDIQLRNPVDGHRPSIRDLLSFRSGLCEDNIDARAGRASGLSLAAHVRRTLARGRRRAYGGLDDGGSTPPLWVAPTGAEYHYSNFGIDVVGLVVERANATGADFATYLRRHVLAPLRIPDEALDMPRAATATGYTKVGRLLTRSPVITTAGRPAAGLTLSAREHLRWMLAMLGHGALAGRRVLRAASVTQLLTPCRPANPGREPVTGLVVERYGRGRASWFGELGGYPWGWVSDARGYPEAGFAIVVATNRWDLGRGFPRRAETAHGLIADLVFEHVTALGTGQRPRPTWAWRRAYVHGLLLADRTYGVLGIDGELPAQEIEQAALAMLPGGAVTLEVWDPDGFRRGFADRRACSNEPAAVRQLLRAAGVSQAEARLMFVEAGRRTGEVPIPSPAYTTCGADAEDDE